MICSRYAITTKGERNINSNFLEIDISCFRIYFLDDNELTTYSEAFQILTENSSRSKNFRERSKNIKYIAAALDGHLLFDLFSTGRIGVGGGGGLGCDDPLGPLVPLLEKRLDKN